MAIKINFKKNFKRKSKETNTRKSDVEVESLYHKIRKCNLCDYKVTDRTDFVEHMENVHSTKEFPKKFMHDCSHFLLTCKQCDFTCQDAYESYAKRKFMGHGFHTHAEIRDMFQCNYCEYSSNYEGNLKRHTEHHHNAINQTCHICGHLAKSKASLSDHFRIRGERLVSNTIG